jgi:hypothetical protein
MITTIINPFDGLLSRYFVKLDPVLNSYYEIAQPITFAGDFEIEFEFSSTDNSGHQMIISGVSNTEYIALISSGLLELRLPDFVIYTTTVVNDGKLHLIKVTRVGTTVNIIVDGVLEGTLTQDTNIEISSYIGKWWSSMHKFNGIIANAKFTDKSGASDVVTTFKLDNSPAANNYTYSTEILDNNTFTDNANARQYLVSTKGWIITDGGAA